MISKINFNFTNYFKSMVLISLVIFLVSLMSLLIVGVKSSIDFTGGTVIFDHGHGISTLFMQLKDVKVKVGQKVKQGQIVGTLGQSGRATGPHLDIRLNWFEVKLDPVTILNLK